MLNIQLCEHHQMMETDLKMSFKDITNYQQSDNYNKVNPFLEYCCVFSFANNRQWRKQNSNEFLFSWIKSCRGSLFWEDAGILIRGHRFSFGQKDKCWEFLNCRDLGLVEKDKSFWQCRGMKISSSDNEAIAYCFVDYRQGSIQEWTGKKKSIETLFRMRNNLSWGTW